MTPFGPVPKGVRPAGVTTVQDVYAAEMGEIPEPLREHWRPLGSADVPRERYYSRDFHAREVDRLWRRVWQMACWESDLPNVGDCVVYDIASLSFLLVRAAPERIKGYYNSCLHRGTQLRNRDGCAPEIRCPFHGWAWNLDGTMKDLPAAWDLGHVDRARMCLPEIRVDTWGGMVFVNPDPAAMPLADFLAPMPTHFDRWWPMQRRAKASHVVKVFKANWKVVMAAFIEGYHAPYTHPQFLPPGTDPSGDLGARDQYDFYEHVGRFIATAPRSPTPSDDDTFAVARRMLAGQLGVPPERLAPEEGLDLIVYYPFPNLQIGASNFPFVTRYRPFGDDPDTSIMDIVVMTHLPEGAEPPPRPEIRWLGPEDSFLQAPELGIPEVYEQDARNMPRVQRGLHTSAKPGITLTTYQESLIRHHNEVLDRFVER